MDQPPSSTSVDADPALDLEDLPPGNHALEVAARRGFGPLSPVARRVWHGDAVPCVTCGQLVRRGENHCDQCGQDLHEEMIEKMRAHSGPWFVLEHLRPFPGVSLDRIVRQIRRGLITETSIVRGPATDYQWRFAVETPGLCRYFGKCWHCYHAVLPSDSYCAACLSHLSFDKPRLGSSPGASPPPGAAADGGRERRGGVPEGGAREREEGRAVHLASSGVALASAEGAMGAASARRTVDAPVRAVPTSAELDRLASAVRSLETLPTAPDRDGPVRIGPLRVSWIAAGAAVLALIALLAVVSARSRPPATAPPIPSTPTAPTP